MIYRTNKKNGDELSQLGFGCMRFAKDDAEMEKHIIYAIENGMNYFDTAYIYPNSEERLGRVLKKGYREKVKIATKLPPYAVKKYEDFDKIFNKQLQRLQTDYIDYYFMHMLSDVLIWERLVNLGVLKFIEEKKKSGQIRNIGFSYHGGKSEFIKLVDIYDWEFCMIQYNFLDENNQAGKSGLEYAAAKGLPVMIMEPLRGGRLVKNLPKEVNELWKNADEKRSPAEWALRWVWNHPQVCVVLSGMSTTEMLEENMRIASSVKADSLTKDELELFDKARTILSEKIKVPCTGCNYCMPCPKGVDIPTCFGCYNDSAIDGRFTAVSRYIMQTTMRREATNASRCTKCGKCELHCPQKIAIRQELSKAKKVLEPFYYKPAKFFMKRFMKLHKKEKQ